MIQTAIWQDTDFRALTPDAQHVYLMLLSQSEVGATGRLPMTIKAWCAQTNLTPRRLVSALGALAEGLFIFDDPAEEELVIRSWVAHNVIDSPTMVKAAADQYRHIRSRRLRERLSSEYPALFDVPVDGVKLPPRYPLDTPSIGDASTAVKEERGKRSVVSPLHPPSDIEEEDFQQDDEDDDRAIDALLEAMGEPSQGQARLMLGSMRAQGASDHDFDEVQFYLGKKRVRSPRQYVEKSLRDRIAKRKGAA